MNKMNSEMAQDILQQAYDGLQGNESWGYFAHDRGSGAGGFLWFPDETSMLHALAHCQLLIYLDSEDMDTNEDQRLQDIMDAVTQYQTDNQQKTMIDRISLGDKTS